MNICPHTLGLLDSLVLHSNLDTMEDTITVWKSLESIQKSGGARYLGLSNTYDLKVLKRIYDAATVKPSFLQNRFYRNSNYDNEIRRFCDEHSIVYQSFWTLTANPQVIARLERCPLSFSNRMFDHVL